MNQMLPATTKFRKDHAKFITLEASIYVYFHSFTLVRNERPAAQHIY